MSDSKWPSILVIKSKDGSEEITFLTDLGKWEHVKDGKRTRRKNIQHLIAVLEGVNKS